MNKRRCVLFCFVFFSFSSYSQNLVPNFSFEVDTACPWTLSQIYYAFPWYAPSNGSSDYYNACAGISNAGVPNNYVGSQQAFDGLAYAGIIPFASGNYREYIQAQLLDTLKTGKLYCVSYYVSLAGKSDYATSAPQLFFSDTAVTNSSFTILPYTPQITPITIIKDTTNWILISGYYLAQGGENFITIGNFFDNTNTQYDTVGNNNNPEAYYYLDDVSIMECDTSDTTHYPIYNSFAIFPSPSSNGQFQITGNFPSGSQFHIYNMLGQEVIQPINLPEGNDAVPIFALLAEGVYVYRIMEEKNVIYTSKLEIAK